MSERTPTLAEVIRRAIDARLGELHVSLPGKVTRVDMAKGLVDVKPQVQAAYLDEEGVRQAEKLPVIANVPVVWPGAGGFRFTFPIAVGDVVLLVFSEASLDVWLSTGNDADPKDDRRHHLSDAIAVPGLRPFNNPWTGGSASNANVGKDGGLQIHFKANMIALGEENPTDAVAMAQKVLTELNKIKTAFDAHTHIVATTGTAAAQSGTAAAVTVPQQVPVLVNPGSTTVKVKG